MSYHLALDNKLHISLLNQSVGKVIKHLSAEESSEHIPFSMSYQVYGEQFPDSTSTQGQGNIYIYLDIAVALHPYGGPRWGNNEAVHL